MNQRHWQSRVNRSELIVRYIVGPKQRRIVDILATIAVTRQLDHLPFIPRDIRISLHTSFRITAIKKKKKKKKREKSRDSYRWGFQVAGSKEEESVPCEELMYRVCRAD